MSFKAIAISVMIAYPSDVERERTVVRDEIQKWNDLNAEYFGIVLLPIDWRTHGVPGFGESPQSRLNKTVLQRADILIALFWTRVGTKTEDFQSGTIEEITKHAALGKPTFLYFSKAPIPQDLLPGRGYEDVQAYRETISTKALYEQFDGEVDLREKVRVQLTLELQDSRYRQLSPEPQELRKQNVPLKEVSNNYKKDQDYPSATSDDWKLLRAAVLSGDGLVLYMETFDGVSVRANDVEFTQNQDHKEVVRWKSVLARLEGSRLLHALSGSRDFFEVTSKGYLRADALLATEPLTLTWRIQRNDMKQSLHVQSSKPIQLLTLRYLSNAANIFTDHLDSKGHNFTLDLKAEALTQIANDAKVEVSTMILILSFDAEGTKQSAQMAVRRETAYFRKDSILTIYQQLTGEGEEDFSG